MTTSISYPGSLPVLKLAGARTASASQTIRSQTEYGPAKVRRRTSSTPIPLSGTLILTDQQRSVLEQFFYETTSAGALAFRMVDPIRGIEAEYRFVSPPAFVPLSPRTSPEYRLEATVELEQLPPTTGIAIVSAGPSCVLLQGAAGSAQFSTSSELTVSSTGSCFNNGTLQFSATENRTFAYARTNTSDGENVSVDWEFTDGDGTSTVTFHRDLGWSYSFIGQHVASPTFACSGTTVRKFTGDESEFPGFRDFSVPAIDDAIAPSLCSGISGFAVTPVFYEISTTATLSENGSCGTPPSRAQGFRDYSWACSTTGVFQGANKGEVQSPPA
tara:strand:+ start:295 stop:1284 length:990 start_codon:yes stop_codon:yes gene_type:complete